MGDCQTAGCTNQTSTPARKYCDECREIRAAPNMLRPGDHPPSNLFFSVAGVTFHPASQKVRKGERLYLVRYPENPHDELAIEVRRESGELVGYVPREKPLQGKFQD